MKTKITITDITTGKSKSEFTSQSINDAIITIAKITKGRICGNNVNSFVAQRMVKFNFTSIN